MKKVMIVIVTSLLGNMTLGYKIPINNVYDGEVELKINQTAGKDKKVVLEPRKKTIVETGKIFLGPARYCMKDLRFRALSGPAKGSETTIRYHSDDFTFETHKNRCSSIPGEIRVVSAEDKTLVVEPPFPGIRHDRFDSHYEVTNKSSRQVVVHAPGKKSNNACMKNAQRLIEPDQTVILNFYCAKPGELFFRFASGPDPRNTFTLYPSYDRSHLATKIIVEEGEDGAMIINTKKFSNEGASPEWKRGE